MTTLTDLRDITDYRTLLLELEPHPISCQEQVDSYLELIDALTDRPMSDGQREIVGLLGQLVHDWESAHSAPIVATPAEIVTHLLEENGLPQQALVPDVFPNRHHVSDFLAGRRSISYEKAGKLAAFFHITPAAFYPIQPQQDR